MDGAVRPRVEVPLRQRLLMTIPAYCYYLPALLIAAIRDPYELDVCVEYLTYRFGPKPDDAYRVGRVKRILAELNDDEVNAVLQYFRFAEQRDGDFDDFCKRSKENLELGITRL